MVRARPQDFMDRLIAAGLEVFGTKGFSSSRMSDVARVLEVSQGTLYNYVESKEALFGLLIERGADPEPVELPSDLPVPAVATEELAARLDRQLHRTFALPALEQALTKDAADDPRSELAEILGEFWETTAATRGHADALERSMPDLPREVQLVFFRFRRGLFERYTRYVASRVGSDQFRDAGSPVVSARFLIENVTLFARHCHRDPDPETLPDSETVRTNVVGLLLNSLVAA
ncbi:MAG: TetR/AcrR family transcriptional regulator [bacterium]|nr:TetR/AcrR family transcriptional regulator [bacterium]